MLLQSKSFYDVTKQKVEGKKMREGTPGRHEPLLCRQEPPFARQIEPLLRRNEHAQYICVLC